MLQYRRYILYEDADIDDKAKDEPITYDNVAIPEIHIRKKKK